MKTKAFTLLFLLSSCLFAQEAPRSSKVILGELRDQLTELKQINTERQNIIDEQSGTIDNLNAQIQSLITSLDKSVSDLTTANENIIKQNEKIKAQRKWLIILIVIFGAFAIAHFVILFLKVKYKINLPYWLNSLI